ncbi:MAG: PilZ domain-containing protein [Treponema sp.]|nr:PilZ domain-containing protein [Treponema sp.]
MQNRGKFGWNEFYAKGREAGFSTIEIDQLRQLVISSHMEDPTSIFWSQDQLDICIRSYVKNMHDSGASVDPGSNDFLSKLYEYRKKIEMDRPQARMGISHTRQISEGQHLQISIEGVGNYRAQIVRNNSQYLTISRPTNDKIAPPSAWPGQKLSISFWRENDAGYLFDTEVLDEVFSMGIASLKISHSENLSRTQKRNSVRVRMNKPAFLYLLERDEEAHTIEEHPGLKCILEDLSDSGCAITVGGRAESNLRIKVQFLLNNNALSMGGTVRSVAYRENFNRSLLHVEADPLPIEMRNQIMGEVFGMIPDMDDDLTFRILDEGSRESPPQRAPSDEPPLMDLGFGEGPGEEEKDDLDFAPADKALEPSL